MGFELHYANENYSDGYVSKITSFRDFLEESIATQQSTVQSKNVDANRQGSGNNCTVSKSFERAKLLSFKSCGEEIDNTPPMGLNSHNYSYMLDFLCEDSQYKSVYMRSLKVRFLILALGLDVGKFLQVCFYYDNFTLNANLIDLGKMQEKTTDASSLLAEKGSMDHYENIDHHGNLKKTQVQKFNLSPDPDANLCISLSLGIGYHRPLRHHEIRLGRLLKSSQELHFLGSQTLKNVQETFTCSEDWAFDDDFTKSHPTRVDVAGIKYPGSFFFIHDTFFVDKRFPDSILMGQRAKEFIHSQGHTSMKIQFMQDTKLADLTCRLGEPYVYIHQGRCEHLLVFRNICMRQTTDKISLEDYPICTYLKKFKSVICRICEEKASRIVVAPKSTWNTLAEKTLNTYRLNDSPCFICNTCFAKFALDEDGEKSFPFVSAPFFDKNTVKH